MDFPTFRCGRYLRRPRRVEASNASSQLSYAVAAVVRRCWKHSRQNTGRPCVGRKGTVVSLPHCEQVVRVSTRVNVAVGAGIEPNKVARLALQGLQRLGSFLNCLSWKNNCSPAVKTNSAPQSIHFKTLSWNSMETLPFELIPARIQSAEKAAHIVTRPAVPNCAVLDAGPFLPEPATAFAARLSATE